MTTLYDLPQRDMFKKEERMEWFWVNWVEGTDGGRHFRWYSLTGAEIEAERLARLPNVMGKSVYLFKCVGKCKVESLPVHWEVLE